MTAIPAEAIPFLGVAVLIADTGYELYAACETMRDLEGLYLASGVQEKGSGDAAIPGCQMREQSGMGLLSRVGIGWIHSGKH